MISKKGYTTIKTIGFIGIVIGGAIVSYGPTKEIKVIGGLIIAVGAAIAALA